MILNYLLFSPDDDGTKGGGAGLGPSLSDLMDHDDKIIPDEDEDEDEDEDNEDENEDNDSLDKEDKDDESDKEEEDDKKDKKDKKEDKGDNEEKGDKKDKGDKEDKVDKKDDKNEDKEDKNEGDPTFWKEVEKITGEEVEVDFGDTEPDTPEGAAKYAKAFRDKGIEEFEANLEKLYPKEYKALQMASEGLDPSSLYKDQGEIDYSKVKIDDKSTPEDQKKWYAEYLKSKGNSTEDILDLVKAAEDKGKLLERAKNGLKELQDSQLETATKKAKEADSLIENRRKAVSEMTDTLQGTIGKGEIGKFIVPEKERPNLMSQVMDKLRFVDGKFFLVEELGSEDIETKLQAEYFKLKKGNLNDLVVRKAKSENTKKLRMNVKKSESKAPKTEGGGKGASNPSLNDLFGGD